MRRNQPNGLRRLRSYALHWLIGPFGILACSTDERTPTEPGTNRDDTETEPFQWPTSVTSSLISQGFAEIRDESSRHHTGIDIPAALGQDVLATASGWIVEVRVNGDADHGVGNTVLLGHRVAGRTRDVYSQYSHLDSFDSKLLQKVEGCTKTGQRSFRCGASTATISRGFRLGSSGNTGNGIWPWQPHLHFEIKESATTGEGYSATYPDEAGYLDPLLFFYPRSNVSREVKVENVGYAYRFGPLSLVTGGGGEFRRVAIAQVGARLQVTAQWLGGGCLGLWLRVRPVNGSLIADQFETKKGAVGSGELRDLWLCDEAIVANRNEIIVTTSESLFAPSDLYVIEPASNRAARLIGRVTTALGEQPTLFDIATAPDGSLWGVSFDHLYRIDPQSLLALDYGRLLLSGQSSNALTFLADGRLVLATTPGGQIHEVNTTDGSTKLLGIIGGGLASDGDLALGVDGQLYLSANSNQSSLAQLVVIGLHPFSAKRLDATSTTGFSQMFGLASAGGILFGFSSDTRTSSVIQLNTVNGRGSLVRSFPFSINGATEAVFGRR